MIAKLYHVPVPAAVADAFYIAVGLLVMAVVGMFVYAFLREWIDAKRDEQDK